jgi:hypothetical protein
MLPTSSTSATHDRNKTATPLTDGVGLKKSAAAAFLAAGLSLAVIGLGAGIANADPDGGGNTPFDPRCVRCGPGPVETQVPIFRPFEDPHTGGKPVDPNTGGKPVNPYTGGKPVNPYTGK